MDVNINLARQEDKNLSDERLRQVRLASFLLLFIVGIVSVLLFLVSFRLSIAPIRQQQEVQIDQILNLNDKATKSIILNSRLSDISSILGSRKKHNEIGAKMLSDIPDSVFINEMSLEESKFVLVVSSNSLLDLNGVLNKTLDLIDSKTIGSATLEELSIQGSSYVMKIAGDLKASGAETDE
jgi:hypothetical protein